MLFLAVALGFFAENLREYFSNSEKEKYYMERLVTDLKADTTTLTFIIKNNTTQAKGMDSMRAVNKNNLADIKAQDSLYGYMVSYLFYAAEFNSTDIALTQLRNAGGYSLIKNRKVLDSIAA